jgi:Trk K+ transport system NAD-binding subunit
MEILPGAPCSGRTLKELSDSLPQQSVVVSLRRANGQMVIPHGNTVIEVGDQLTAYVETASKEVLRSQLLGFEEV